MCIDFLANMNTKAIDMNTMRPKHTKKINKKAKQYDITKHKKNAHKFCNKGEY
jgi:hypothetical protein